MKEFILEIWFYISVFLFLFGTYLFWLFPVWLWECFQLPFMWAILVFNLLCLLPFYIKIIRKRFGNKV